MRSDNPNIPRHRSENHELPVADTDPCVDARKTLRREIVEGLLYAHSRLNANTTKTLEASSFLYAIIELLNERGIITIGELDERKRTVAQRLSERFRKNGNGVMLQDPEYDKYRFDGEGEID